jgi:peptidoglycan hydrolase-like protein with peptidoglycan-binding domain
MAWPGKRRSSDLCAALPDRQEFERKASRHVGLSMNESGAEAFRRTQLYGARYETLCKNCHWRVFGGFSQRVRYRPNRFFAGLYSACAPSLGAGRSGASAQCRCLQRSRRRGVWGPDSVAALQRFQASHQLQVTGQLNQATAVALGLDPAALLGTQQAALPPPVPPAETLRQSSVRAIQGRLRSLGFYRGAVDGVWGQSTQNAIEQFQQNRGLQPNGQLTPATVTGLGLAPDSLAYR